MTTWLDQPLGVNVLARWSTRVALRTNSIHATIIRACREVVRLRQRVIELEGANWALGAEVKAAREACDPEGLELADGCVDGYIAKLRQDRKLWEEAAIARETELDSGRAAAGCDCAGCSYAREQSGAHAEVDEDEPTQPERRVPVHYERKTLITAEKPAGTITWSEHVEAWEAYAALVPARNRGSYDISAERVAERGGFGYYELVKFLGHEPKTWRPR